LLAANDKYIGIALNRSSATCRLACRRFGRCDGEETMRIAIGSDHRGFDAKRRLVPILRQLGHEVTDVGPESQDSVDYPDYAYQRATRVGARQVERGIRIRGPGLGTCIAAR